MIRMTFSSDMPNSLDMKTAFDNANTTTPGAVGCWIVNSHCLCVRDVGKEMRQSEDFFPKTDRLWIQHVEGWMKPHFLLGTATATILHTTLQQSSAQWNKERSKEPSCFLPYAASCSFNAKQTSFKFYFGKFSCRILGWITTVKSSVRGSCVWAAVHRLSSHTSSESVVPEGKIIIGEEGQYPIPRLSLGVQRDCKEVLPDTVTIYVFFCKN